MKKLVLILAIMATAAIAQGQEYKFPGWKCRDMVVLNEQLALASYAWEKADIAILINFAQNGDPATIDEMEQRIRAITEESIPTYDENWLLDEVKNCAMGTKIDAVSFERFCRGNPSYKDMYFVLWGLLDTGRTEYGFQTVADCLIKYKYEVKYVVAAIAYLNKQAIALGKPDAEMLGMLTKLNRVFSARLIEDKEAWGGVVAQIRTLIDVYK